MCATFQNFKEFLARDVLNSVDLTCHHVILEGAHLLDELLVLPFANPFISEGFCLTKPCTLVSDGTLPG
jgi:hypothetical protein